MKSQITATISPTWPQLEPQNGRPFISVTPTCPQPNVSSSHYGGIHERHIFLTLEAQFVVLDGLLLQRFQTEALTCSGPLAFDETKNSNLLRSIFEISNDNVPPFLRPGGRGLLRIHNEVFASGEDITIKNNFHKSGCFVLFRISNSGVDIRNMSFTVLSLFCQTFNKPMQSKS